MIKKAVDYIGNPENSVKLRRFFYITLVMVVLLDIGVHLFHTEHTADLPQGEHESANLSHKGHDAGEEFIGEKIWGFWAIYGFIGCIIMIFVCKGVGHAWLMKKENYYD
ncbi:MAG: hypothetical protein HZA00_10380 [Nitrospinae bacterium]|nr:hypothetical protein [Nitrospinota bacterium]